MCKNGRIDWCERSQSFWIGCEPLTLECDNCFAARDVTIAHHGPRVPSRTRHGTFFAPLRWKDPARVFVMPWSDFFIEAADDWRVEAWSVIRRTPHLTWVIITKRPQLIPDRLPGDWGDKGWNHVWLGVSVGDDRFSQRIYELLEVPAKLYVLCAEPLIGPLDLSPFLPRLLRDGLQLFSYRYGYKRAVGWVIIGGECGRRSRPIELWWVTDLIEQCRISGVPCYVKQLGEVYMRQEHGRQRHRGHEPNYWPQGLRVREFPTQV